MHFKTVIIGGLCASTLLAGCNNPDVGTDMEHDVITPSPEQTERPKTTNSSKILAQAERKLLWGDTHLHTKYSFDSYALFNRNVTPDDAYRFARGLPVIHPLTAARVQLHDPLDFLVVSDHAEFMGVMQLAETEDPRLMKTELGRGFVESMKMGRDRDILTRIAASIDGQAPIEELLTDEIRQPIWNLIVEAADRNYRPGEFTALIGWEWTSFPNSTNLHRVVFTPDDASVARQFLPFSSAIDDRPEALWDWLESTQEDTGARFVAIPHNSNLSLGRMFDDVQSDGSEIDRAYAETRISWEPVVEVVQAKGASETHPFLSPEDEFAAFELYEKVMDFSANIEGGTGVRGNYVRDSLRRGLEIENEIGVNPFKFGLIGSSDIHTGLTSTEEDNFLGKYAVDSIPANKFDRETVPNAYGVDASAQGLAAVWADENTREGIYEAFRRKEVYATTGPRIQLRVFAGWNFKAADAEAHNIAEIGYREGVPMGSDLPPGPEGAAPRFLIHAVKDPRSGNLDRLQVVKGWRNDDGTTSEKVFNAALSDGRSIDANGKALPVGNSVDVETGTFTNDIGEVQLATVWEDPEFNPDQNAFYYIRVLEIPTPRHSLYDSIALQKPHPEQHTETIQERAFSSPIWFTTAR